jgi:signal transduction histidine kinase
VPTATVLALTDAAVGTTLLLCGAVAWRARPASRTGLLMVATGGCWFAGSVVGVAVFLHRGPLVHLHISYPTGRLRRRLAVGVVGLAYVSAVAEGLSENSWLSLLLAVLVAVAAVDVFTRTSGPARKAGGPALGAALAFAAVLALASANQLLGWDADTPVLLAYDAVVALVSVVLLVDLLRGRWTDDTLADLVTGLGRGAGPEGLRGHLRRGLGDPSLTVGFWVPEQGGYVDDEGRPLDVPEGDATRAVTRVEDRGQPLAVLVHDAVVLDDPGLVDGVAAVAQLAVTNARLRAEVRARVAELAASRRRIVEAGDDQRSQLERALATGAERRLAEVDRLLTELVPAASLPGLAEVRAEVQGARTDLHDFAQGVRPTALGEGGLAEALPVLAARSGLPVSLTVTVGRLPPAVESALYFVCSEAMANVGKHARATSVTVVVRRAREDGDVTVLTVEDDGVGGADPRGSGLRGLADRVEALGGAMSVTDGPAGGTLLTARIPAQPVPPQPVPPQPGGTS